MDKLVNNIVSYLDYLNRECDLAVSVHYNNDRLATLPTPYVHQLLKYNSHDNPYCLYVKSRKVHFQSCIAQQQQILSCGRRDPFCHTCYAGVFEFAAPFFLHDQMIGYVAVSGYRRQRSVNILDEEIWQSGLSEQQLPEALCNTLIPPLCLMLEKLFSLCQSGETSEINMLLQYLNEVHTSLTLDDLCQHFSCSRSHISHLFKKNTGMTVSAYCNRLKLEDARKLLKYTPYSVARIAEEAGFSDPSYFIKLFRQTYQLSPLQYRKNGSS